MRYFGLAQALAWMATIVFLELNDVALEVEEDDAVGTMLAVAAGEIDEATLTAWLAPRIRPLNS